MTNSHKLARWYGVASVAMTLALWVLFWLPNPEKVDSALQRLPLLAPLSWILVWLLAALGLGIAASVRRRKWWIVAPCLTAFTGIYLFMHILD